MQLYKTSHVHLVPRICLEIWTNAPADCTELSHVFEERLVEGRTETIPSLSPHIV